MKNTIPMLSEILSIPISVEDRPLQIVYESLYRHNPYDFMPDWKDIEYAAPETTPGYCVRTLRYALNQLEKEFTINARSS